MKNKKENKMKGEMKKEERKASKMGRGLCLDSGKNLEGVWNGKRGKTSLLLIVIILISIIILIIVVSALIDDERASLQNELNSLQENLSDSGYSWLVNQNGINGGEI